MEKRKIKLEVFSQHLTVISDESEEYVKSLGEELNNKVKIMVQNYRYRPVMSAVALCAMQYCDDLRKLTSENSDLKKQIESLQSELSELKKQKNQSENRPYENRIKKPAIVTKKVDTHQQSLFDKDKNQAAGNADNKNTN